MTKILDTVDLSDKRKVFVVGDIHGCFTLLEQGLSKVGFDREQDALVSVGDLVDRGPESSRVEEFLEYPWFFPIQGNHEQMCLPQYAGTSWHVMNGGAWIAEYGDSFGRDAVKALGKKLNDLPIALEVVRGEKKYGFVHASLYDVDDWSEIENRIQRCTHLQDNPFVWDRMHFYAARRLLTDDPNHDTPDGQAFLVDNIDHVYFGHTPIKEPMTYGNCSWIDTGAFATDILTIQEIT